METETTKSVVHQLLDAYFKEGASDALAIMTADQRRDASRVLDSLSGIARRAAYGSPAPAVPSPSQRTDSTPAVATISTAPSKSSK